jgi:hypothetical protein
VIQGNEMKRPDKGRDVAGGIMDDVERDVEWFSVEGSLGGSIGGSVEQSVQMLLYCFLTG